MITLNITVDGQSAGEVRNELQALLNGMTAYKGEPISTISADVAKAAESNEPRMTAAQRKAAEKAAREAEAADKAAAAGTGQGISTGEERVNPEVEKQDAKDEAAETKAEPVKLNHDSVRKMLGGYVMAYGMEAAQADGVGLIGTAKISDLKDDPTVFAKAIVAIATGIEKNPNKREIAGDGITAEKLAELKPIVAAAKAAA